MTERGLRYLDGVAASLLLLWAGLTLGFWVLPIPTPWMVPVAERMAPLVQGDWVLRRVDLMGLLGFGLPLLLVWLPRFLQEIGDEGPVGPLRLWTATALVGLLMSFASLAIVGPRLTLAHASGPMASESWARPAALAQQFALLRLLLALGLAWGTFALPRLATPRASESESGSDV